jgi:hypothetical protein
METRTSAMEEQVHPPRFNRSKNKPFISALYFDSNSNSNHLPFRLKLSTTWLHTPRISRRHKWSATATPRPSSALPRQPLNPGHNPPSPQRQSRSQKPCGAKIRTQAYHPHTSAIPMRHQKKTRPKKAANTMEQHKRRVSKLKKLNLNSYQ